jgi:ectoine hydroxylase-related dioxygenase (phytanoyl-CoA dioxygenase family)
MSWTLSTEEQQNYARDGYLVREAVFDSSQIANLAAAAEAAAAAALALVASGKTYILDHKRFVDIGPMTLQFEHSDASNTLRVIEPVAQLQPELGALLRDPRLVEPMRQLVGSADIGLWTNKLNLKRPREGSGFGWHQDSPYWIHDCNHVDQLPNVMLAFDAATAANGCLRVIRGSHTKGCLPGTDDGTALGGFFTSPDCFDLVDERALTVPAGSLIFFSPHIIHGSGPNHSDLPRRAIIITYQPAGHPTLKTREIEDVHIGFT